MEKLNIPSFDRLLPRERRIRALQDLYNQVNKLSEGTGTATGVPDWALQATKPTYTADEVGAVSKETFNETLKAAEDLLYDYVTNDELNNYAVVFAKGYLDSNLGDYCLPVGTKSDKTDKTVYGVLYATGFTK